jgi:hypothetical protein
MTSLDVWVTSSFFNGRSLVMDFCLKYLSNSISNVTFCFGPSSDFFYHIKLPNSNFQGLWFQHIWVTMGLPV